MNACEGYVEDGKFYPLGNVIRKAGKLRAILTILDEPATTVEKKPDTWAELDKIVSGMNEKPLFEDFPRCQLGCGLASFGEA